MWINKGTILEPREAGFDNTAVKDPSVVCFQGTWHVFYTAIALVGDDLRCSGGQVRADGLHELCRAERFDLSTVAPR